jgi:hypothetical protein
MNIDASETVGLEVGRILFPALVVILPEATFLSRHESKSEPPKKGIRVLDNKDSVFAYTTGTKSKE